jgi:hypothetical protein
VVVYGKVNHTTSELKKALTRVSITLVLLDSVFDRLLGEAVLEFKGGNRQAVDEKSKVEGKLSLVSAIDYIMSFLVAIVAAVLSSLLFHYFASDNVQAPCSNREGTGRSTCQIRWTTWITTDQAFEWIASAHAGAALFLLPRIT